MVTNMEKDNFNGSMKVNMRASSKITIFMDWEHINGAMVANIQENGATTKCMVEVSFHGQMGDGLRGIILMTEKKAKDYSIGQMERNMMEDGLMASSTESDIT